MSTDSSRRAVLAGVTTALLPAAGCVGGFGNDDPPDSLTLTLINATSDPRTVTVRLTPPDGPATYEATHELAPDEDVEFEVDNTAPRYVLETDVASGPADDTDWDPTVCNNIATIYVQPDAVEYGFSAC